MNVRHRRMHRTLWPALLVALLPTALLGIAVRQQMAVMASLPEPLAPRDAPAGPPLWQADDAFGAPGVRLRVWSDCVELTTLDPLRRPDPFVYYSRTAPDRALPGDAVLLGALPDSGPVRFLVPGPIGYLALFSLADGEILATAPLGGRR